MALHAPDFIEADYWTRNRGRYLGLLIAIAVVIFGVLFFRNHRETQAAEAWGAMVDEQGVAKETIELDGPVEGSDAEPWALFHNAQNAFSNKNLEEAERFASRLQSEFADHPLNRDDRVQRLLDDIRAEQKWLAQHPLQTQNPDVDDAHAVTIQTSLGAVKIGLYPEQAPEAVAAFLDLVRNGGLASGDFHLALRENWIAFSAARPGADADAPEDSENESEETPATDSDDEDADTDAPAEPSKLAQGIVGDRNDLSHYAGAVSFLRNPPGTLEPDAVPHIAVYLRDAPYKDGQEVVFGRVLSGLDILSQASTRETEEGSTELSEPLAIEGIDIGTGL